MATIVTRSGKGSPLTHAEVDSNFTNLNTDKLETAGGSMTGNLSFGDNDKAIFGAGSDLQIYHDGSNSYISDQGTGNLVVKSDGSGTYIKNASDENIISAQGDEARMHYAGPVKLKTTSTGIDVTGTVTADGLTVESAENNLVTVSSTDAYANVQFKDSLGSAKIVTTNGTMQLQSGGNTSYVGLSNRINIGANGDISFYEDTGTTAKFFWDASAENLLIGTGTATHRLTINGDNTSDALVAIKRADVNHLIVDRSTGNETTLRMYENGVETNRIRTDGDSFFNGGNVGIGRVPETTTSTYKALELGYSTSIFARTAANQSYLGNNIYHDSGWVYKTTNPAALYQQVDDEHVFFNAASGTADTTASFSEAMRIDSSGNVGIGVSSPSKNLEVHSSTGGNAYFSVKRDNATSTELTLGAENGNTVLSSVGAIPMAFYTNGAERMRIDSSGNLLVGTTAYTGNTTNSGGGIRNDGLVFGSVNGGSAAVFNRISTDGDIALFRKDGSTVGSIGTNQNGNIQIYGTAASHVGLQFGSPNIMPVDNTGASSDGGAALGSSSIRFSDLYLSGGVYLGGTGSANKLDDYEEGAFTLTVVTGTVGSVTARYTKIGQMVTVRGHLYNFSDRTSGNNVEISNLPFTARSNTGANGAVFGRQCGLALTSTYVVGSTTRCQFYNTNPTGNYEALTHSDLSDSTAAIYFMVTYETDS